MRRASLLLLLVSVCVCIHQTDTKGYSLDASLKTQRRQRSRLFDDILHYSRGSARYSRDPSRERQGGHGQSNQGERRHGFLEMSSRSSSTHDLDRHKHEHKREPQADTSSKRDKHQEAQQLKEHLLMLELKRQRDAQERFAQQLQTLQNKLDHQAHLNPEHTPVVTKVQDKAAPLLPQHTSTTPPITRQRSENARHHHQDALLATLLSEPTTSTTPAMQAQSLGTRQDKFALQSREVTPTSQSSIASQIMLQLQQRQVQPQWQQQQQQQRQQAEAQQQQQQQRQQLQQQQQPHAFGYGIPGVTERTAPAESLALPWLTGEVAPHPRGREQTPTLSTSTQTSAQQSSGLGEWQRSPHMVSLLASSSTVSSSSAAAASVVPGAPLPVLSAAQQMGDETPALPFLDNRNSSTSTSPSAPSPAPVAITKPPTSMTPPTAASTPPTPPSFLPTRNPPSAQPTVILAWPTPAPTDTAALWDTAGQTSASVQYLANNLLCVPRVCDKERLQLSCMATSPAAAAVGECLVMFRCRHVPEMQEWPECGVLSQLLRTPSKELLSSTPNFHLEACWQRSTCGSNARLAWTPSSPPTRTAPLSLLEEAGLRHDWEDGWKTLEHPGQVARARRKAVEEWDREDWDVGHNRFRFSDRNLARPRYSSGSDYGSGHDVLATPAPASPTLVSQMLEVLSWLHSNLQQMSPSSSGPMDRPQDMDVRSTSNTNDAALLELLQEQSRSHAALSPLVASLVAPAPAPLPQLQPSDNGVTQQALLDAAASLISRLSPTPALSWDLLSAELQAMVASDPAWSVAQSSHTLSELLPPKLHVPDDTPAWVSTSPPTSIAAATPIPPLLTKKESKPNREAADLVLVQTASSTNLTHSHKGIPGSGCVSYCDQACQTSQPTSPALQACLRACAVDCFVTRSVVVW